MKKKTEFVPIAPRPWIPIKVDLKNRETIIMTFKALSFRGIIY